MKFLIMYDYLIVGSGLYGAIFAHEAKKAGKSVLVVEKRPNIGGNIYTEKVEGIIKVSQIAVLRFSFNFSWTTSRSLRFFNLR